MAALTMLLLCIRDHHLVAVSYSYYLSIYIIVFIAGRVRDVDTFNAITLTSYNTEVVSFLLSDCVRSKGEY